jgi:hypothetical protein
LRILILISKQWEVYHGRSDRHECDVKTSAYKTNYVVLKKLMSLQKL